MIPNGYGQCGTRTLVVPGPLFAQVDISLLKRINVSRRVQFDFMAQVLNVFNRTNFTPVGGIGNRPDAYEVLNAGIARQAQLSWRVSW